MDFDIFTLFEVVELLGAGEPRREARDESVIVGTATNGVHIFYAPESRRVAFEPIAGSLRDQFNFRERARAHGMLESLPPELLPAGAEWLADLDKGATVIPQPLQWDLFDIFDVACPEAKKLRAVDAISERLPRPVHQARWPRAWQQIREEADLRGIEVRQVLHEHVRAVLIPAVQEIADLEPPDALRGLKAAVNRETTESVLGPAWWRDETSGVGSTEGSRAGAEEALIVWALDEDRESRDRRAELEATLLARAERARLTDYARQVLLLAELDGLEPSEIAHRLGKEPGAVRTALHRARAKTAM